jgi:hypothetical protein
MNNGHELAEAKRKLRMWLDAEEKVAQSQSYEIEGRSLNRANLTEIANRINFWQTRIKRLSRGGLSVGYINFS